MFSKMTSQTTTIYTPFADGRTVRDIVEHSPALVNEAWCRNLLRHSLDSLERQYATGAPHRPISPDTIVMLANNEPLLLPAPDEVGPAGAQTLAADLHALALVVHYAITAELPPDGPLGPRLYDNYSDTLTNGLDRCLGPNGRLRPKTVADMRAMLGIEAASTEAAVHASSVAAAPVVEERLPVVDDVQPVAPPDLADAAPAPAPAPVPDPVPLAPAPIPAFAAVPADASEPATPRLRTPSAAEAVPGAAPAQAAVPERRAELPPADTDAPLLRTPAAPADTAAPPRAPTALEAATAARLHEEAARNRSAAAAPAGPAKPAAAPRARANGLQRWGWIAGAVIVLLAAGGALVSYLQQDDALDVTALSASGGAADGLGPGETVVAPSPEAAAPAPAVDLAPGTESDPAAAALPADASAVPAPAGLPAAASALPGKRADAAVNGTTYKLVIKPWGTVYVDGIDRGVSPPVKRLTLSKGLHTIQIVNPNFPDHVLTVDAGSKESATIQHDFTAKAE